MNLEVLIPLAWICWAILFGALVVGTVMMARGTQSSPEMRREVGWLVFASLHLVVIAAGWLLYHFTQGRSEAGILTMLIVFGFVLVMSIAGPGVRAHKRWRFEQNYARVGSFEDPSLIPIAEAIHAGDHAALTLRLGGKRPPPGQDRSGHDLLGYALVAARDRGGSLDCVRAMLEAGSDPRTTRMPDGRAPIHFMIIDPSRGGREAVQLLLKHGADPNAVDPITGDTPIRTAGDSPDLVRALCEAGADVDRVQSDGVTALVEFVARQQWESACYLVEQGARLDSVNEDGLSLDYYLESWKDSVFGAHPEGWDRVRAKIAARGKRPPEHTR